MVEFDREFHFAMALALATLHGVALVGCVYWYYSGFYTVSWILASIRIIGGGLGVSVWYHRYLTHKSFVCKSTAVSYVMTYFGGLLQDAESWVSNHLSHHAHTDTALDPYSVYWPYKGGIRGLWWAHMGCLCWKFTAPDRFMKSAPLQSSVVR